MAAAQGNSNAEKPWAIFFQPYLKSRAVVFCPSDPAPHSNPEATTIGNYNGGISNLGDECTAAPNGEQCVAEAQHTAMWSYVLNSVFTHKSCSYAVEGALNGFATDAAINALPDPNLIMFSERNSAGLDDPNNDDYGYVPQDDYDTWAGEAALVRWGGTGPDANFGLDFLRPAQRRRQLYLRRWSCQVAALGGGALLPVSRPRRALSARESPPMKSNTASLLALAVGLTSLTLAGCTPRPPQVPQAAPTSASSAHASDANAQSRRVEQQILQTRSARTRARHAAAASRLRETTENP